MTAPLICLHGFTGSPRSFLSLDLPFAFAPLLSGHGGAPDLSAENFDDELARIAREISVRLEAPAHLLGYSLGARVALGLLLRFPHMFSGATLLGVNPGLSGDAERAERLAWDGSWATLLERDGLNAFEEKWSGQELFASQGSLSPSVREEQRLERLSHTAWGLAHALRVLGLGTMPNYWPRLGELQKSTVLMFGAHDHKFADLAETATRENQTLRAVSVAGAGHNLLLEAPLAVRREVLRSLEGAPT